ncbi:hypothetical protein LguiB_029227 [Lonicera macranthoides]
MSQQRRSVATGRPSGTDGSDFSYRMVVDSRYKKVGHGKSRLSSLIFSQAFIQLLGALHLYYTTPKGESLDSLAASSTVICFISLIIGELGRKQSRVNFLKFYMFGTSIGVLLSIAFVLKSKLVLKVVQDSGGWETKKLELFKMAITILGSLVQIFSISTTISLICNMSPPKRAS